MPTNSFEGLMSLLSSLLPRLPLWIVWLVAVVFAVRQSRQCPRASLLTVVGLALSFFISLATTVLYPLLPRILETARLGTVFFLVGIVVSIGYAVGWGLVLVAVFSDRRYPSDPKV